MATTNNNANGTVSGKGFLAKSGWVFVVIGVIALIAGLIMDIAGIWIPGATSIASGVYCLVKAKQLYPDTTPQKPA